MGFNSAFKGLNYSRAELKSGEMRFLIAVTEVCTVRVLDIQQQDNRPILYLTY